jgi:hypothetical protein
VAEDPGLELDAGSQQLDACPYVPGPYVPEPRNPNNSTPKHEIHETIARRARNERSMRDGVSIVLLFQVL